MCSSLTGNIVDASYLADDFAEFSVDDAQQQQHEGKKTKKRKTERDTDTETEMETENGKDEKETETETETEGDTETEETERDREGESVEDWIAGADAIEADTENEHTEEDKETETDGEKNSQGTHDETSTEHTRAKAHSPLPPNVMAFAMQPKIERALREEAAELTALLFDNNEEGFGCLSSAHTHAHTCGPWDGHSEPLSLSQFHTAHWQILTTNIETIADYASSEQLHSFLRALLWPCARCGGCYAPLFYAVTGRAEPR